MKMWIHLNGTNQGPFSIEQVKQMLLSGQLLPTQKAFIEGQTQWIQLSQIPELQNIDSFSSLNQQPQRKVGVLLGFGIFLMPYIFSWFTLRRGYSTVAKVVSFVWLGLLVLSLALSSPKNEISSTSPDGKKATLIETNSEPVSSISWQQIDAIYDLKSKSTDIQKREAWKTFKGKKVVWSGVVSEITEGLLGGLKLQIKMDKDTLTSDLLIRLKKSEKGKVSRLSKGDIITFSGTLDDWGTILPITLDDGEVLN